MSEYESRVYVGRTIKSNADNRKEAKLVSIAPYRRKTNHLSDNSIGDVYQTVLKITSLYTSYKFRRIFTHVVSSVLQENELRCWFDPLLESLSESLRQENA